ncbi:hypothetical protein Avbf_09893, partial [Armadillidium vulgare]
KLTVYKGSSIGFSKNSVHSKAGCNFLCLQLVFNPKPAETFCVYIMRRMSSSRCTLLYMTP